MGVAGALNNPAETSFAAEAQRRLMIALDLPNALEARAFWEKLALPHAVCKVGLELLCSGGGIELARELSAAGIRVFVDAKLHDIGNTVERASSRIAALGAAFLTVHAQDRETLRAAMRGRGTASMKLLGVTVLTSANKESISEQGISLSLDELVMKRASFAADAGFDGIVCSPLEAAPLKASFGNRLSIVCPGIRPQNEQSVRGDDQSRAATPAGAIRNGADYLVVGRPILRAPDPAAAARAIIADIAEALRGLSQGSAL